MEKLLKCFQAEPDVQETVAEDDGLPESLRKSAHCMTLTMSMCDQSGNPHCLQHSCRDLTHSVRCSLRMLLVPVLAWLDVSW